MSSEFTVSMHQDRFFQRCAQPVFCHLDELKHKASGDFKLKVSKYEIMVVMGSWGKTNPWLKINIKKANSDHPTITTSTTTTTTTTDHQPPTADCQPLTADRRPLAAAVPENPHAHHTYHMPH